MEEVEATGTSVITDLELQSPRRGRKLCQVRDVGKG